MAFTLVKRHQLVDGIITDAKVASDANIAQSKIQNLVSDLNAKVDLSGDTMTGFLTLNDDPVSPLHAVPKRYVDSKVQAISLATGLIIKGFRPSTPIGAYGTSVVISAGTGTTNTGLTITNNSSLTVNLSTSGLLGIDTGGLVTNTFYYLYIITNNNGTLISAIASTSPTAPNLTALPTYTSYIRLPIAIRTASNITTAFSTNDSGTKIIPFFVKSGWPQMPEIVYRSYMDHSASPGGAPGNPTLLGPTCIAYLSGSGSWQTVNASSIIPTALSSVGLFSGGAHGVGGNTYMKIRTTGVIDEGFYTNDENDDDRAVVFHLPVELNGNTIDVQTNLSFLAIFVNGYIVTNP